MYLREVVREFKRDQVGTRYPHEVENLPVRACIHVREYRSSRLMSAPGQNVLEIQMLRLSELHFPHQLRVGHEEKTFGDHDHYNKYS